jgi:hypothetical protein
MVEAGSSFFAQPTKPRLSNSANRASFFIFEILTIGNMCGSEDPRALAAML